MEERKKNRIKELVEILNKAGKAYYRDSTEIMPNLEYDRLYDELLNLEEETGIILSGSPTVKVGGEILSFLPKEDHEFPMLSLNKTKNKDELLTWLGNRKGILSWKLDGLTVVLTYEEGKLSKAVTRGNGETGEVITANARTFRNLPLAVPFREKMIIRGESVIGYKDFFEINEEIPEGEAKYKNPRNLCSGSVRQLNPEITRERRVNFFAFALVVAEGETFRTREEQLIFVKKQGFDLALYRQVKADDLLESIEIFKKEIEKADLPSDGLVLAYDDLDLSKSLGATSKAPRDAIAFKWQDELAQTKLEEVIWNASRTGLINPIAVFRPVELEGTTVKRASVHNVSILKELRLGEGDEILVYKANMIIPQIAENITGSGTIKIPEKCPACNGPSFIKKEKDVEVLLCPNPSCPAKEIKAYTLLCSRNGLNIEGLSEATLGRFIGEGLIHEPADIFKLGISLEAKEKIVNMEGFGEKSYNNIIENIEKARETSAARLLYSLGIPGIGDANAKLIAKNFKEDVSKIMDLSLEDLLLVPGIGDVLATGYVDYFNDPKRRKEFTNLLAELVIERVKGEDLSETLQGLIFVITGGLNNFSNREELVDFIEERGGQVSSSVSKNTDYLINNDSLSVSGKNKKAKELGVPIINEEDFLLMAKRSS